MGKNYKNKNLLRTLVNCPKFHNNWIWDYFKKNTEKKKTRRKKIGLKLLKDTSQLSRVLNPCPYSTDIILALMTLFQHSGLDNCGQQIEIERMFDVRHELRQLSRIGTKLQCCSV